MSFITELKRRNVFRVAVAYLAGAWLLSEVSATLFPLFGFSDTPVRIIVILLAIGFPLFLVFSWIFEITPEGLKLEKDIRREVSLSRETDKKLDRAIIVLLILAVGYFAVDKFVLEPARVVEIVEETTQQARSEALVESYGDKSIAVLPFVNMSDDPDQEYFSDGISEELLNLLAQIPELRVISRSSAFYYKGKDIPVPEIAKQLHVEHVLEGSIRKAGDRVRITAQLIAARSDAHLWSQVYDRKLGDIFAIQEEIARAIGHALELKLVHGSTDALQLVVSGTGNVDAYDVYLQGRELVSLRDADSLEKASRLFERALRLDAKFAPAHAQLAIAAMLKIQVGAGTREDARHIAGLELDRARELEPRLAEGYYAQALLVRSGDDPESAIEYARKALSINPSYSDALTLLGGSLNRLGRYAEADGAFAQVLVTDPLNPIGLVNYIERLNLTGRTNEAHVLADRLLTQSPMWGCAQHAYTSALYEGKVAEGLEWALKLGRESGNYVLVAQFFLWIGEFAEAERLAPNWWVVYWAEGRLDEAINVTQRSLKKDPDDVDSMVEAAIVLSDAGRIDEARPLLERALDLGPDNRPINFHLDHLVTMLLAEAKRRAGDESGAQAVAEIVRKDHAARVAAGQKNENLDIWGALVAAFDGDRDRAIALLRSAVQRGLRDKNVFDVLIFEPLWDDTRYIQLRADLDTILDEERTKVLQLICFNNPVPDDWRPLPETCEGVVQKF